MQCKICKNESRLFSCGRILGKYDISYFQCSNCGFIQTEEPYWLEAAYSDAIADSDIGLLSRNIHLAKKISAILKICFKDKNNFLDYGGGYGIFVRLMRDKGFKFVWYDKFCKNLFSPSFVKKSEEKYDVSTAFELFEHFDNPSGEIENMFSISKNIIFSTSLLPKPTPTPNEWWYYSLNSGQHISFYTKKSLEKIAEKHHKYYAGIGDMHVFSEHKIPLFKLFFAIKFSFLINNIMKKKSLLQSDYQKITGVQLK